MKMLHKLYSIIEVEYFESGDFNGMPIYRLVNKFDILSNDFREIVQQGLEQEILTATFHGNTHIKAFSNFTKDKMLEWFDSEDYPSHICLYPHPNKLKNSKRIEKYRNTPYLFELAKGAGKLDYRTFELSVLEHYRNDPRYYYNTDFIHGSIFLKDEHFESDLTDNRDKTFLRTFGFAYDEQFNRYVAVFLKYLSELTPEHQRIWAAKEVNGSIKLHPDYYASSIEGSWGSKLSIFEAFFEEVEVINKMSLIIGKPKLFLDSYSDERPKEFGFLLRPTQSEFNNFMLLLDKMMSDNINKKFFQNDVDLETEEERKDGKVIIINKGTIQILESWINKYFKPTDRKPLDEMISTFKKVRKLRQPSAHKITTDSFNQTFFHQQRQIVIEAYSAIRTLRQVLANHPKVKLNPPEISQYLFEGKIWDI